MNPLLRVIQFILLFIVGVGIRLLVRSSRGADTPLGLLPFAPLAVGLFLGWVLSRLTEPRKRYLVMAMTLLTVHWFWTLVSLHFENSSWAMTVVDHLSFFVEGDVEVFVDLGRAGTWMPNPGDLAPWVESLLSLALLFGLGSWIVLSSSPIPGWILTGLLCWLSFQDFLIWFSFMPGFTLLLMRACEAGLVIAYLVQPPQASAATHVD